MATSELLRDAARVVEYGISGGLSDAQAATIHRAALRVLEEVGVEVRHDGLRARLEGLPGVRSEGARVRFAPELVDDFVSEYRRHRQAPEPPGTTCSLEILTGYALYLLDPDTDRLRPMTTADCITQARLVGSLYQQGVRGGTPGMPQDVAPPLRQLMAYKIGCEHTRTNGWVGFTTVPEMTYLLRMAEITGGSLGLGIFPIDPLCLDGPTLSLALHCLDAQLPMPISITNMALRGMTAPYPLPAAFVNSLSTVLATFTAFRLLSVELPFYISVFPFDYRGGNIVYGTPDHVLCNLWSTQLNAYYGTGWGFFQSLHTNAVHPDAHALLQRGVFSAVGALAGARSFGYGGCGGIDVTFSPELLLYDVELLRYLEHVIAPVEFTETALGLAAINEVGPRGDFLGHESTLDHYRESWDSRLFASQPAEYWLNGSAVPVKEKARQAIRQLLDGYEYQLAPEITTELDCLYAHAEKELGER